MYGGVTILILVPEIGRGAGFYTRLLGRPPDREPHEDLVEWEVSPGCWFQVAEGPGEPSQRVRFKVDDIIEERIRVRRELPVDARAVRRMEGLVATTDFEDPWGNRLGFYQQLYEDVPDLPGGSYLE